MKLIIFLFCLSLISGCGQVSNLRKQKDATAQSSFEAELKQKLSLLKEEPELSESDHILLDYSLFKALIYKAVYDALVHKGLQNKATHMLTSGLRNLDSALTVAEKAENGQKINYGTSWIQLKKFVEESYAFVSLSRQHNEVFFAVLADGTFDFKRAKKVRHKVALSIHPDKGGKEGIAEFNDAYDSFLALLKKGDAETTAIDDFLEKYNVF